MNFDYKLYNMLKILFKLITDEKSFFIPYTLILNIIHKTINDIFLQIDKVFDG